ncbi:hypothetical protein S7711_00937 [Stachybotrys chartarum IBT 7711]|uniref:Zn(2)-C6 fungal-type domain-containing protein n=1 Tax=Stachybotrys chartarum (strain CBS 109288 / IBT 7711) TaxID=1280523 RepID=A0A084B0N6_STACB|nr:hypothetical protein S7711_00937 [Stachybotrys chartarum IBT 7711]KFA45478.1 hypothetical protein S40293_10259 [Stachybotrys chartarum IBT 40293]KFA73373.1 hypothetical protein S40288_09651 [Stachybotrys chartarum IBT 40288]
MDRRSSASSSSGVPKHRACDECRSRKLACTKEPDGCARCKRERIRCHYSPQKPMGRPRKKRLVEDQPKDSEPTESTSAQHDAGAKADYGEYDVSMSFGNEPQFDFLGHHTHSADLDFIDLLHPTGHDAFTVAGHHDSHLYGSGSSAHYGSTSYQMGYSGPLDMLMDVDPYDSHYEYGNTSKHYAHSLGHYMTSQAPLPSEPAESTPSELSNSSPEPSLKSAPTVNCGCLSSLYLALDALTRIPQDVVAAMRVVRHASKVAHDVIACTSCSANIADHVSSPPPIQSFQNRMCLAALIPTACNAYARILEMVDDYSTSAKNDQRMVHFSFKEVGGVWGLLSENPCLFVQPYDNKDLDPATWRRLMRGIVKLDVNGLADVPGPEGDGDCLPRKQLGLKGIVQQMEERSRRRHAAVDVMMASGKMPPDAICFLNQPYTPVPEAERSCMKVLDAAKMALDRFVIV